MLVPDATLAVTIGHVAHFHLQRGTVFKCTLHRVVRIVNIQVVRVGHRLVALCSFADHDGGYPAPDFDVGAEALRAPCSTGFSSSHTPHQQTPDFLPLFNQQVPTTPIQTSSD